MLTFAVCLVLVGLSGRQGFVLNHGYDHPCAINYDSDTTHSIISQNCVSGTVTRAYSSTPINLYFLVTDGVRTEVCVSSKHGVTVSEVDSQGRTRTLYGCTSAHSSGSIHLEVTTNSPYGDHSFSYTVNHL